MTLGVNNHVAFCGKNNGMHKILKKVDKLGVEAQKEMELEKRPIAEQMEVRIREAALGTSFKEKIRKILGRIL